MKFGISKVKQALGEVQTTLHWEVTITSAASAAGAFPENTKLRVTTSSLPVATSEDTQVELGGHKINFVGKLNKNGELTWKFFEGTDAAVTEYFMNWAKARWSGDGKDTVGKQSLTKDLKADIQIQLLGPDDEITQTYVLVGCMPKIDPGGELGQTSDAMQPSITFTYDDFHWGKGSSVTW